MISDNWMLTCLNNFDVQTDVKIYIPPIKYGKVIKTYDGDTITIVSKPYIDSDYYKYKVRLNGIDTPELKSKDKHETEMAIKARDALKELLKNNNDIIELKNISYDKYGRLLADVYANDLNICEWMIAQGYAKKYGGGKKEKFD